MADNRLKQTAVATAELYCMYKALNPKEHIIKIGTLSLFVLIGACQAKIPSEQDASLAAKGKPAMSLQIDAPIAPAINRSNKFSALSKMCGDTKISIVCDSDVVLQGALVDCRKTALQMERNDGSLIKVGRPDELAAYTAVGFGCAVSENDKAQYLVVEYGELPYGCNYCEWFYLFDFAGKQLTKSDPIIISDESLPVGNKHYSNNEHYSSLSKSLRLSDAEIDYVACDAKFNPSGSSSCLKEFTNAK